MNTKTNLHKTHVLLLFLGTCLLYFSTLSHQFTLDDELVLTQNKYVHSGNYWDILTHDTFAGYFTNEETPQLVDGGRYRPLTLVIFTALWSVTESPQIYHALNVLMFALTVVVIYWLTLSLQLNPTTQHNKHALAAVTALLFAIHPIHTEVVNNVKGLDDILSLLFGLMAWKLLLVPNIKNKHAHFICVMLLMLLAMLSKESAIMILPMAVLSLWYFRTAQLSHQIKTLAPMILAVFIYLLVRISVIPISTEVQPLPELMNDPFIFWSNGEWLPLPWDEHLGTVLLALLNYLTKVFFPFQLSHDYYPHAIPVTSIKSWSALLSLVLYFLIVVYVWVGLRKKQLPAFALFIYLVSLSLFANIFFDIGTRLAERFLYLPSLGICLLVAWCYIALKEKFRTNKALQIMINTVFCVLITSAIWKVNERSADWHNNLSLFEADILKSPNSAKLNNALGGELISSFKKPLARNEHKGRIQVERAITYLNRAIELHPTYAMPHLSKGNALHYLGHHPKALASYKKATSLKPNYQAALSNIQKVQEFVTNQQTKNRRLTLENKAISFSQKGEYIQAITIFNELINEQPSAKHLFYLGVAKAQSGQLQLSLNDFKKAEEMTAMNDKENLIRIWQALMNTHNQLNQADKALYYQDKLDKHNK